MQLVASSSLGTSLLASLGLESHSHLGNELNIMMTSSFGVSSLAVHSSLKRYSGSLLPPSQVCIQHPKHARLQQISLCIQGGTRLGALNLSTKVSLYLSDVHFLTVAAGNPVLHIGSLCVSKLVFHLGQGLSESPLRSKCRPDVVTPGDPSDVFT